jgi:hypothetical protein
MGGMIARMKGLLLFGALVEAAALSLFGVLDASPRSGNAADTAVLVLLCAGLLFDFLVLGRNLALRATAVAAALLAVIGSFVLDFLAWNFFPLLSHDIDPLGLDHLEALVRPAAYFCIPCFGCALAAKLIQYARAGRTSSPQGITND